MFTAFAHPFPCLPSPVHHIITASVPFLLLFSFHSFLFSKVAITSSHCSPLFCRPIPQKKRLKTVMCVCFHITVVLHFLQTCCPDIVAGLRLAVYVFMWNQHTVSLSQECDSLQLCSILAPCHYVHTVLFVVTHTHTV